MNTDLCSLVDDKLPLYTEGLLPSETRQRIDDHAAECATCRERLHRAMTTLAPPSGTDEVREVRGRRLAAHLRRTLLYALAGIVVLLVGAGGWRYASARKVGSDRDDIPARVTNAEQVAARAIPGWQRAKTAGLVVDIGISEKIAGTDATITLEKGWYTESQTYILYTVKAPKGGHVLPTLVRAGTSGDGERWTEGGTDSHHLKQWSGFSPAGFHGVIAFPQVHLPDDVHQLQLNLTQWAPVTADAGMAESRNAETAVSLLVPWGSSYLQEPAPEIVRWGRGESWLARTLVLDALQVGAGHMELSGRIAIRKDERRPNLMGELEVGEQTLTMRTFQTASINATTYHFIATYDGPSQWPAPVKLMLSGISFETERTLEWPVNWAKYRDLNGSGLMAPADQFSVRFYESDLISSVASRRGITFAHQPPTVAPPYVRAAIRGGGRGARGERPGMEVVNASGEVLTDLGGGGGHVDSQGREEFSLLWGDQLPERFRQSDELVIRYVNPSAALIVNETWELPPI